jgi:hypothetical protein
MTRGSVVAIPSRMRLTPGATTTLAVGHSTDTTREFWQRIPGAPPPISAATNGTTASGNPLLHFASGPDANIQPGDVITDTTAPAVIPASTKVLSIDGAAHTVTMTANAAGAGVGSGDTIVFTRPSGTLFIVYGNVPYEVAQNIMESSDPETAMANQLRGYPKRIATG